MINLRELTAVIVTEGMHDVPCLRRHLPTLEAIADRALGLPTSADNSGKRFSVTWTSGKRSLMFEFDRLCGKVWIVTNVRLTIPDAATPATIRDVFHWFNQDHKKGANRRKKNGS